MSLMGLARAFSWSLASANNSQLRTKEDKYGSNYQNPICWTTKTQTPSNRGKNRLPLIVEQPPKEDDKHGSNTKWRSGTRARSFPSNEESQQTHRLKESSSSSAARNSDSFSLRVTGFLLTISFPQGMSLEPGGGFPCTHKKQGF